MKETKAQRQARLESIYNANENISIDSLGGFNAVQKDHEWFIVKDNDVFSQWKLSNYQVDKVFEKNGVSRLNALSEIVRVKRIALNNSVQECHVQ